MQSPHHIVEPVLKAKCGLALLKEAVLAHVREHPAGVTNAQVVKALELDSDFEGENRNYLSWSILGLLVNEKRIAAKGAGRNESICLLSN